MDITSRRRVSQSGVIDWQHKRSDKKQPAIAKQRKVTRMVGGDAVPRFCYD
jgi:hypothetical protein